MKFTEIELVSTLQKSIEQFGFEDLTEVQEKAIPAILENRDVTILSQTGSGKTFSFLIPFVQRMLVEEWPTDKIGLIVIVPTRELAMQIAVEAEKLLAGLPLSAQAFFGGSDIEKQIRQIKNGVSIAIFTPGRLIDFLERRLYDFGTIPYMVIDEADRLFDMGFVDDLRHIFSFLTGLKNRVMASATLSNEVIQLADRYMQNSIRIEIQPEVITVDKIDQGIYHLGNDEKKRFLVNYLRSIESNLVMIFANTKDMVDELAELLTQNGFKARGISSRLTQNVRTRLIKEFRASEFSILIATDLASRGLDIDGVTHVVNYDLPDYAENYVHRIGRTARAGKDGVAISLCSERDYEQLHKIEDFIEQKIEAKEIEDSFLAEVIEPAWRKSRDGRDSRDRGRRPQSSDRRNSRGRNDRKPERGRDNRPEKAMGEKTERTMEKTEQPIKQERPARNKRNERNDRNDRNRGNQRGRQREDYTDYSVASAADEPMVTVFKKGAYIDPVEVKRELSQIEAQETKNRNNRAKKPGLISRIASLFKGKKTEQPAVKPIYMDKKTDSRPNERNEFNPKSGDRNLRDNRGNNQNNRNKNVSSGEAKNSPVNADEAKKEENAKSKSRKRGKRRRPNKGNKPSA